ncbi:EF-hand domain-containing protein [Streptomyces sp. NPDC102467]|uniref:EF-hand domain-containing protein n=1 Tax=Streptomyces sp. NPDC102467 TaxID=3366179 RepID=UPI0037FE100C
MPGPNFLDKKLSRRFRTYDTDQNGVIEKADFDLAAQRMGKEFGHKPNSPQQRQLNEQLTRLWEVLAEIADTDHDGRITEDEYKNAFRTKVITSPEAFDKMYRPFIQALINVVDSDKDGKVDQQEHVRWYRALMNVPEKDSQEAFSRLDEDGDGYLTREEILKSVRDFYFNDDPTAPGNMLLGPI